MGADDESLKILKKFRNKILEALKCYYKVDIEKCNTIIRNLGSYDRQYPYTETKYSDFDKFCFLHGKTNRMEKEKIRFSGTYQLIKESNIALPQHSAILKQL